MIDCSHGNSSKKFEKQIEVAECISKQLCDQVTKSMINGVMIESNLFEGRQDLGDGTGLKFGVSVTDACISWEDTIKVLDTLADAVEKRRSL